MKDINIISIIANGAVPNCDFLNQNLIGTDMIIAADGGADICRKLQIKPQYIVGDLDSITEETIEFFKQTEIIHIPDQNSTDLEKSITFARNFSPGSIRIFCASGNRIDHTMNNILHLQNLENCEILEIFDDHGVMKILHPGENIIKGSQGNTISFFSLSKIKNLKLTNFEYVPDKSNFDQNFCSISNVLTAEKGVISFSSGKLLVYQLLRS